MFARIGRPACIVVTSSLIALAAGCSKEENRRNQPAAAAPAAPERTAKGDDHSAHAPAGVKPGSHEDWCAEHEVPESQCTRCNPALIPAFKATNDWCEEHQLPLSQDQVHNPDLVITRPPKGA
jgi:hypothetical protein